jgi:2',3'-cyclic-nucleotide 2'-phosphodiesterase (5'-nucleotidase family)
VADLVVDPMGHKVVESSARVLTVYAGRPRRQCWTANVSRWNEAVGPIAAEVLGDATLALHRRRPESTIGDFICDAMRTDLGVDIAMQNPGGMRADMDAGPITRGDVYAVMPFDNTMVTLELTAEQVKLALEQALRGSRITQVSGIHYVVDTKKPAMERVVTLDAARWLTARPQAHIQGRGEQLHGDGRRPVRRAEPEREPHGHGAPDP